MAKYLIAILALLASSALAVAADGTVHEVTGDKVRIRAGPGTRFPVVGHLDRSSLVVVTATEGRWRKVRVPGGFVCFVHSTLVSKNRDGTADVTASRVLLRATADKDHAPLAVRLERGDSLTVLGAEGEWLKVIPPERVTAWIFDGLVTELGPADEYRAALARAAAKRRKALVGDRAERDEKIRAGLEREARRKAVLEIGRNVLEARGDTGEQERRLTKISLESDDDLTRGYANALIGLVRLRKDTQRLEKLLAAAEKSREVEAKEIRIQLKAAKKRFDDALKLADLAKTRRENPFRAVGTVEKRDGGYALIDRNKMVYRLRSKRFRIADYVGKRVGVNGRIVVTDLDKKETHLLVEKLEILPGKAPGRKPR